MKVHMSVSIIVAVYNVGEYIAECLESIIPLDKRVIEILCVDDGSSDQSVDIIRKYQQKDKRIQLLQKKNGGISSARNCGLDHCRGNYVAFVDGDDFMEPELFCGIIDEFSKAETDAIWCGYMKNDWNGVHEEKPRIPTGIYGKSRIETTLLPALVGLSFEKLYSWFKGDCRLNAKNEFPSVWRGIYSVEIIKKNHIYFCEDVLTGEDLLFNCEYFSRCNNVSVSERSAYHYVWRKGSLTQNTRENFWKAKMKLLNAREKISDDIYSKTGICLAPEFQGTLVLSKIQMALMLSDGSVNKLGKNYKRFKQYSNNSQILSAYRSLNLNDAPVKYRLPLSLGKWKWDAVLFFICIVLNKFHIHIYPDE